jgi:hypothetical protein
MGLLGQTLILYLVVGAGVAGALYLTEMAGSRAERWFRLASSIPFWPIYIPILLSRPAQIQEQGAKPAPAAPPDEMAVAIGQVDAELAAALSSLDGWAEDVLAREKGRFQELRAAWTAQAARIRDMDRVLALPAQGDMPGLGPDSAAPGPATIVAGAVAERLRNSRRACRKNVERLRQVRMRTYEDLMATLAWVRELVSMIHLAKFTGAPAARAEELVAQIAAAVAGLSEVTWQEEPAAVGGPSYAQDGKC